MSQASDQRKREILMLVSASRLGVVNAAIGVKQDAQRRVRFLHGSRAVFGVGAAVISGVVMARLLLRALKPHRVAVQTAAAAVKSSNPWGALTMQLISVLLLPLAQQYVLGKRELPKMPELPKISDIRLPRFPTIDLSTLFYRWLGLIK